MNAWDEDTMNYVWNEFLKPVRIRLLKEEASELSAYHLLQSKDNSVVFGPQSDIIGCVVIGENYEGANTSFMWWSPQNRVKMGNEWNYNLERAWKSEIKTWVVEEITKSNATPYGVLIYWDPFYEHEKADPKLNKRYICEHIEEIYGEASNLKEVLEYDINRRLEELITEIQAPVRRDS